MNIHRSDPYRNFRFLLMLEGQYVAAFSKVSGLTETTQADWRSEAQADGTAMPTGLNVNPAITLRRGLTHDPEFEKWCNNNWSYADSVEHDRAPSSPGASLQDFRKDFSLRVFDEARRLVIAYNIRRCWVSQYEAIAELDVTGNTVAIELITLENEGWERDLAS